MTVAERIIQDYLAKGLKMEDVPRELKYRLNDRGEMKIYRYLVERGDIQENPPEPEKKPTPKTPEPQQRPVEQPKGAQNTMNTYLAQMRDALSSYYTTAQRLMAQKEKNSETYQAEVAEEQNRGDQLPAVPAVHRHLEEAAGRPGRRDCPGGEVGRAGRQQDHRRFTAAGRPLRAEKAPGGGPGAEVQEQRHHDGGYCQVCPGA